MSRRAVGLVAWREIEQRARGRAFLFGTLAIVVLVFAAALIPSLGAKEDETLEIGLVGRTPAALVGGLDAGAESIGATLAPRRYGTLAAGERALRDGEVGVLVVDGRTLVWKSEPNDRLQAVAGGAIQRLQWLERAADLGVTASQAQALLAPQSVSERRLDPADPDEEARYAAALLGLLLLGLTLSLYGQAVANGVAQEKGTRVMEVLLARVSARELLAGKVLGIGLVGLAQLLVAALASLAAIVALDQIEVPSAVPSVVGWVILWFVLGYAFYSVLYAALGALVSRAEDVEGAQAPLGFFLMGCRTVRDRLPGRLAGAPRLVRAAHRPVRHARPGGCERRPGLGGHALRRDHDRLDVRDHPSRRGGLRRRRPPRRSAPQRDGHLAGRPSRASWR